VLFEIPLWDLTFAYAAKYRFLAYRLREREGRSRFVGIEPESVNEGGVDGGCRLRSEVVLGYDERRGLCIMLEPCWSDGFDDPHRM